MWVKAYCYFTSRSITKPQPFYWVLILKLLPLASVPIQICKLYCNYVLKRGSDMLTSNFLVYKKKLLSADVVCLTYSRRQQIFTSAFSPTLTDNYPDLTPAVLLPVMVLKKHLTLLVLQSSLARITAMSASQSLPFSDAHVTDLSRFSLPSLRHHTIDIYRHFCRGQSASLRIIFLPKHLQVVSVCEGHLSTQRDCSCDSVWGLCDSSQCKNTGRLSLL